MNMYDEVHEIVMECMKYPLDIRSDLAAADIIRITRKPKRALWSTTRR